jgi:hypothetical protein
MLTLSRNHDVLGVFETKEIMESSLFASSNLNVKQINKLLEEDRLELPGYILVIEEYIENSLDDFISQEDVFIDNEEDYLDELDLEE